MDSSLGKEHRVRIFEKLKHMSEAKVNDAVKLAFLSTEQLDDIDSLDLTTLSEFKRGTNGVVEMKFIDKLKVMEQVMNYTMDTEVEKAQAVMQVLSGEGG